MPMGVAQGGVVRVIVAYWGLSDVFRSGPSERAVELTKLRGT